MTGAMAVMFGRYQWCSAMVLVAVEIGVVGFG